MTEPIQRGDTWWHRQDDGSWLRWNEAASQWQPSSAPPPPPPGPGSATETLPLPVPAASTEPRTVELPPQVADEPRRSPSPTLLIVLGLALLVVAGIAYASMVIGGDARDPAPVQRAPIDERPAQPAEETVSTPDKQTYITALDSICARVLAAQRALREPQGRRGFIRHTTKVYALNRSALKQMRKVPLPEEGGRVAAQLLSLWAKALGHLEDAVEALRKDDARAFGRALARTARVGSAYNEVATVYGFQECNQDR